MNCYGAHHTNDHFMQSCYIEFQIKFNPIFQIVINLMKNVFYTRLYFFAPSPFFYTIIFWFLVGQNSPFTCDIQFRACLKEKKPHSVVVTYL